MPDAVVTDDIVSWLSARSENVADTGGPFSTGSGKSHKGEGGVSRRSQARLLSSLRSFFGWYVEDGNRSDNPCDGVDTPKLGRYLPDVMSVEEVASVMDAVDLSSATGRRDRAVLEVLYGCGLRVSELSSLKISNVYLEEGYVRVVGKGNKERIIPIGEVASGCVSDYLEVRGVPSSGCEESARTCPRILSAIRSPPISSRTGRTSGWSRKCSDTSPYSRPRFIPMWTAAPGSRPSCPTILGNRSRVRQSSFLASLKHWRHRGSYTSFSPSTTSFLLDERRWE